MSVYIVDTPMTLATGVAHLMPGLSKRKIKEAIHRGRCLIDGKIERFYRTQIFKGQKIELLEGELDGDIKLLYEGSFTAIDKPAGRTSEECAEIMGLRLIHRLDRDTSGCLLMATDTTRFENEFRSRNVDKEYLALVAGDLHGSGVIDNHLGVTGRFDGQTIYGVVKEGKRAITQWEAVGSCRGVTAVRCVPLTGRTHQIRVHLATLGHPVIGDGQYGRHLKHKARVLRHQLHATRIVIQGVEITAPIPDDMAELYESTCC